MTNSYNYKTYYLGTPKKLEESQVVYLFNSSSFNGTKISLENLKEVSSKLYENRDKYVVGRKTDLGDYKVTLGKIFEFDVILYCSESIKNSNSNPATGYTIFSAPQKCYSSAGISFKELQILVTFNKIEGKGNGYQIEIKNALSTDFEINFSGEQRFNYPTTSSGKLLEGPEETYLKFTNRIQDFKGDSSLGIITDSGVAYHDNTKSPVYQRLFLLSGVEVDSNSFGIYRVGVYRGDICIFKYSVNTREYCVSSLSSLNPFGRPHDYLSGIADNLPDDINELLDYTGETLLFKTNKDYILYTLETKEVIRYPIINPILGCRNYVIIDRMDMTGKVRYISETDIFKEISGTCPVPEYFEPDFYRYYGKLGDWWIMIGPHEKYYYLSVCGCIISDIELDFLSSRIALLTRRDNKNQLWYHFCPIEFGHIYEYPVRDRIKDTTLRNPGDIVLRANEDLSNLSDSDRCFLDGIRRKPIRTLGCLPNSKPVGCVLGSMFYLDSGLLYCY